MKPKNKSLYLVVGFIVIILIILAVVFTTMKKNNDIPDTEDSLPNETDNTEEVIDTNNDKDNFIDALISIDETVLTEQEKFELIDFGKRIFSPVYDPPVSLITETGLDLSAVSSAPWTCVVTPDGDQTKTFYFQFNQKISASKFIWQVSFYPFSGGPTSVTDEFNTILQSGELSNRATAITVDFAKVYAAERTFFQPQLGRHNIDLSPNLIFKMSEKTVTQALKDYNTIPLELIMCGFFRLIT